jgi:hypothetical protein
MILLKCNGRQQLNNVMNSKRFIKLGRIEGLVLENWTGPPSGPGPCTKSPLRTKASQYVQMKIEDWAGEGGCPLPARGF